MCMGSVGVVWLLFVFCVVCCGWILFWCWVVGGVVLVCGCCSVVGR